MLLMWIIIGAIVIPLQIAAIFLLQGKGAFLISGFNMMSPAEKATYDKEALCRSVGKFLMILNVLMLLFPLSLYFSSMIPFYVVFILTMIVCIGYAVYANTGNRFRIADYEAGAARAPMSRGKKAALFIGILVSFWALVGISYMFYAGEREPVVTFEAGALKISGMYAVEIKYDNIKEVTLIHKSMREIGLGTRTNGFGGNAQKGHFRSDALGAHMLFVYPDSPFTILIERNIGNNIYFSFKTGDDTVALYQEIIATALSLP